MCLFMNEMVNKWLSFVIEKGAFKTKYLLIPEVKIFDFFINIVQLNSKKNKENQFLICPNIEFLYIHPARRSLKCGTALLTYCKEVHSALSVCTVNQVYNKAIKFYRGNNFKDYKIKVSKKRVFNVKVGNLRS